MDLEYWVWEPRKEVQLFLEPYTPECNAVVLQGNGNEECIAKPCLRSVLVSGRRRSSNT